MLNLKVYKDNQEVRNIEVENNNFLLVQNGMMGPVYDTENFKYLKIDDKHIISQGYLDIVKQLYVKFDKYLYSLWPEVICCMVDMDWQPSDRANKNSRWKIDIVRAGSLFKGSTMKGASSTNTRRISRAALLPLSGSGTWSRRPP